MSKPIYKLTGGLAHVITTGEPVYINGFDDDLGVVFLTRPVVTQNGIEYRNETFPVDQLESPYAKAKRSLEFEEFVQDLHEKMQEKRFGLTAVQKKAMEAQATDPSQGKLFPLKKNHDVN